MESGGRNMGSPVPHDFPKVVKDGAAAGDELREVDTR
jgi:hypothetical protein